jgi:aminoglycoside phosphotransferase (APT) family kinase protein
MRALAAQGIPVPEMLLLCEDESVIGRAFFIMSQVDGRILWDPTLPQASVAERGAIYDEMNRVLAALHSVDVQQAGLGDFGKAGNYFARQIGRWSKQYLASETETIEPMNRLIDWLPRHVPPGDETAVVHGDYRIDNLIFHPSKPRIIAVLDWELSTLGDPIADFSYLMLNWKNESDGRAGLASLDLDQLGIPTMQEAVDRYVARTGYPVPPMDWYFGYNLFRLAGIMQGIKKRVIDGTASSAHAKGMSERVTPLIERAYDFAVAAGMPE